MATCHPWLSKDGCKGLGGSAVGYWGRDINKRICCDNTTGKELTNLRDEVNLAGINAAIWIGVTEGNTCGCYKKTYRSADRKCRSCHGVVDGLVPGYLKWGYKTVWMSPVDDGVTLTNVKITTDFHSAKAELENDALEGSIESSDIPFSRTAFGSYWEFDVAEYNRNDTYSSVTTEYSLNSGSTWNSMDQLPTDNPVNGSIRFRSILTRDSESVLSPLFEIVRARYAEIPLSGQQPDGSYDFGPWIKVVKTVPETTIVKSEYGDYPLVNGLSFWTVGLSAFDSRIDVGSEQEKLEGPNVVVEFLEGTFANDRFAMLNWALSDPRGFTVMTQTFKVRAEDSVGPLSLVW